MHGFRARTVVIGGECPPKISTSAKEFAYVENRAVAEQILLSLES